MPQSSSSNVPSKPRHFIDEPNLTSSEFRGLISSAIDLKSERQRGTTRDTLHNKTLAMIFQKASTRTRTSFESGMAQLGGHALNRSPADTQLDRGEPIEDTSRVLSQMVDVAMLRTHDHSTIENFAKVSDIPVINGLSDQSHPCQLLADMQTFFELRGDVKGAHLVWLGAINNVCKSYIATARLLDFNLTIACPAELIADTDISIADAPNINVCDSARSACENADAIITDVWASMGEEQQADRLKGLLTPYQVNRELMDCASPDAIFMHCLPAHRGEEVTAEVIDGPNSVVWQEAGNRLHSQKALLEFLLLPEARDC